MFHMERRIIMGLRNGKTIELAMKMYNYIKNIPENVLFGNKKKMEIE